MAYQVASKYNLPLNEIALDIEAVTNDYWIFHNLSGEGKAV